MTSRYVSLAEYRCDSCLVAKVVGNSAELPEGWTEHETPAGVRHYCPECPTECVAPEEPKK